VHAAQVIFYVADQARDLTVMLRQLDDDRNVHKALAVTTVAGQPAFSSSSNRGPIVFPPGHAGTYWRTGPSLSCPARARLAVITGPG
jgi:hypothetical protein